MNFLKIRILDCSFTTPEKASVCESSINLIRGLLRKDPETRLTIEEIFNHPWLENTETNLSGTMNKKVSKINVNEQIIDLMIDQGIALSKEAIRNILKNDYSETIYRETDEIFGSKLNDHYYIKATYHLLKDKSLRECRGLDPNRNLNYNKRGNILKKPNYNNLKRLNLNQDKSGNSSVKTNPNLQMPNLSNLEVPQSSNSFPLPLARKCSIVSEEGSACLESISLPESIPVEKINEQKEENTIPIVDIFVTEPLNYSSENLHKTSPIRLPESISEFSFNQNEVVNKKLNDKLNFAEVSLHPVSSSPDFLNSEILKYDEERISNLDRTSDSKENFDITELNKDSLYNRYKVFSKLKNKKLSNVRIVKSSVNRAMMNTAYQQNKSPAMRVIIQSKSLNNIALAEQSTEAKLATSKSSVNIKPSKSDKTDCCTIS